MFESVGILQSVGVWNSYDTVNKDHLSVFWCHKMNPFRLNCWPIMTLMKVWCLQCALEKFGLMCQEQLENFAQMLGRQ